MYNSWLVVEWLSIILLLVLECIFFAKILLLQISSYEKELEEMKHMTRQEYIAYLRR